MLRTMEKCTESGKLCGTAMTALKCCLCKDSGNILIIGLDCHESFYYSATSNLLLRCQTCRLPVLAIAVTQKINRPVS